MHPTLMSSGKMTEILEYLGAVI